MSIEIKKTEADSMTNSTELPEAVAYCKELWPSADITSQDLSTDGWLIEITWFSSPFKIMLWASDGDSLADLSCGHDETHRFCMATSGSGAKRNWRNAIDIIVFKIGTMVAPVVSCLKKQGFQRNHEH